MILALLLGCQEEAGAPHYHLLYSGQAPLRDTDLPGAWETELDGTPVWSLMMPVGQGAFGAMRWGQDTVLARSGLPPNAAASLERVNEEGVTVWSSNAASGIVMPHGLGVSADPYPVVGDLLTWSYRAIGPDGEVAWQIETSAPPSGMTIGTVRGRSLLFGSLVDEDPFGSAGSNDSVYAWDLDNAAHPVVWRWPPEADPATCLWVHAPHLQADGRLLVAVAGLGQIVELDPLTGEELARVPETQDLLTFPRDAVILPDGDLVVVDATEILRIEDPFGAFRIVSAEPVALGFSARLLDCAQGLCYGD